MRAPIGAVQRGTLKAIEAGATEEGETYHGGYRVRYALTERGKKALG